MPNTDYYSHPELRKESVDDFQKVIHNPYLYGI